MPTHFDALEPRQLLAFTGNFTDTDGDEYTITLTGPGDVVVVTQDLAYNDDPLSGFIETLTVTNTTASSRLKISVKKDPAGDGRVNLRNLSASVLRSATMPAVDLVNVASFTDVGQLALGDVADDAALEVSLNPSTNNLGARTALFRNVGNEPTMDFGEFLASVRINDSVNIDFFFGEGVKVLSSNNSLIGRLGAGDTAVFSELRARGLFQMRANINSDIKVIAANEIQTFNSNRFQTTGSIAALTATTAYYGSFEARSFGSIVLGLMSESTLNWTAPDAKGVAIKSLRVTGGINSSSIGPEMNATAPGTIASLRAGSITGSIVDAGAITTFLVSGGITQSNVMFMNPSGVVGRAFTVAGRIVNVGIETANSAGIASFRAQGLQNVSFSGGFISSLTLAAGDLGGIRGDSVITLNGADSQNFALKTARLGAGLNASSIIANADLSGFVGSVTGASIENTSTFIAPRISRMLLSGNAEGFALRDATIRAIDATTGAFSLGTLDFRGIVTNTNITSAASIDRFTAREVRAGTFVDAGRNQNFFGLAPNTSQIFPGNRINRITITGTDFALNGSAAFNATAIGTITLNGPINTSGQFDGGDPFGFAATTFGRVTLKNAQGQTVRPTIPTAPGDFNPFLPASSGNFTIRVLG